jgi:hypothetical protein
VRFRNLTIGLALILLAAGVFAAPVMAKDPSVSTLKPRLRHATELQHRAHERVTAAAADLAGARSLAATASAAGMSPELVTRLLADGVVTADEVATLQTRLAGARRVARRWDVKVRRLDQRIRQLKQIAEWNRRGQWKPLIAIAAARYDVGKAGLYHMMMLESGGQRHADSGPYHGLFQFMDREWNETWNEWRDHSIYDGWSQIQLAAKCIGRGMGPSIWPLTYRMSF